MSAAVKIATPCMRGFERIGRFYDAKRKRWVAKILPGEFYVTAADEMLSTVLGSCVSACIRDPKLGVGGMNHFMLVNGLGSNTDDRHSWGISTRYGLHAMEQLINQILSIGGDKQRLEVKIFGGGRILNRMRNIGGDNVRFVQQFLADEGIEIASQDVLGDVGRKLYYLPRSGRAFVKHLPHLHERSVLEQEKEYAETLTKTQSGDIELF